MRELIDRQQNRLHADVPADRQRAVLALLRCQNQMLCTSCIDPTPNIVTGHRLANPGGNRALQLVLEARGDGATFAQELDSWGERFLQECGWLAEAELVLAHCETGFMRLVESSPGVFDTWIATKRMPTIWRELADFDWWASWLARRHESELNALGSRHRRQPDRFALPPTRE